MEPKRTGLRPLPCSVRPIGGSSSLTAQFTGERVGQEFAVESKRRTPFIAGLIAPSILAIAAFLASTTASGQQYTATDLGAVDAISINNAGQIAGSYLTSSSEEHAFLYSNGQLQDLGAPAGAGADAQLWATGLNDSGQVVGYWWSTSSPSGPFHPFLYSQGQVADLTAAVGVTVNYSVNGISDSGQLLLDGHYLYSTSAGTTTDIAASAPQGFWATSGSINRAGQVDGLGTITTETPTGSYSAFQAYLYSNGSFSIVSPSSIECPVTVQDAQEFPENYSAGLPAQYDIRGIGPQGQLLGTTTLDPTEYGPGGFNQNQGQLLFCLTDAMVYANGQTTSLGQAPLEFEDYSLWQGINPVTDAQAMDSAGTVVGFYSAVFMNSQSQEQSINRAFISTNGVLTDLSSELQGPLAGTVILENATGINECGEIVAEGFYTADTTQTTHSFLLSPSSGGAGGCGSISLVDPLPSAVNGSGVLADAGTLSSLSNVVAGAAADGAAEIVVKIEAATPGTQFELSLEDENGQPAPAGSANALGYLTTLLSSDDSASTANGAPITVTTVPISAGGSMAFAIYHAPVDFVRDGNSSDQTLASRKVTVAAADSGVQFTQDIKIVRPPIVFVHGIWGHPSDGNQIAAALQSAQLGVVITELGYDGNVQVLSSSPSYGANYAVSGNDLGFKYAGTQLLSKINNTIVDYRTNNALSVPIASVRADVIAHSMGGDITRSLPGIQGYTSPLNYNAGPIHKLIAIGTPHLGSPLATQLAQTTSSCTRNILRRAHLYAFTSVKTSVGTFTGGVGDLEGDLAGDSTSLSAALQAIQPGTTKLTVTIPTGLIPGSMTPAQLATVDTSVNAAIIRKFCSGDPLATALTSTGWPTTMGQGSDAIVPLNSQIAGFTSQAIVALLPAVHSPGTEDLGFAAGSPPGPSEIDAASGVASAVEQLLNAPVTDSLFTPLP